MAWQEKGMGAPWARHAMCESALTGTDTQTHTKQDTQNCERFSFVVHSFMYVSPFHRPRRPLGRVEV